VLAGMPLEELQLDGTLITDVSPLLSCPTLKKLVLPARARESNRFVNCRRSKQFLMQVHGVYRRKRRQTFGRNTKHSLGGGIFKNRVSGQMESRGSTTGPTGWISEIHPLPIWSPSGEHRSSNLDLCQTAVSDLGPLRGMPLRQLWIYGTPVTDLGPLKGAKLESLNIARTEVKDISVLRGMPLTDLKVAPVLAALRSFAAR
jgi:Leucine-rich repeat (LRR) protein